MRLKITPGLPIPPLSGCGKNQKLLLSMSPGDSVEARREQMDSFRMAARRLNITITVRRTAPGRWRLWRLQEQGLQMQLTAIK